MERRILHFQEDVLCFKLLIHTSTNNYKIFGSLNM
jgi:hypothetical protein